MFESVLSIRMLRRFECRDDNVAPHYLAIQIVHQNKSAASKRYNECIMIETVPLVIAQEQTLRHTHLLRQPS